MIIDGIITGALNPKNEGKTITEALVREINEIEQTMTSLRNVFDLGPDSVCGRLRTALADPAQSAANISEMISALVEKKSTLDGSLSLADTLAYFKSRQAVLLTLLDCEVLPDMSNLQAVLEEALPAAKIPIAIANLTAAQNIIAAMEASVTYQVIAALTTAVLATVDSVNANVVYMRRA
jgi:hypothetical protein